MQTPTDTGGSPAFDGAALFAFADVDLPDGDVLYDRIMSGIEPELMSKSVPTLKAKYAGETPEARKARGERYAKAYAEYDRQYAEYQTKRDSSVIRYKAQALKSLEADSKRGENAELADLEQQMHTA